MDCPTLAPPTHLAKLKALHPTQMTVGMREVSAKRQVLRGQGAPSLSDGDPSETFIPVVRGPSESLWIIDRHHLARALYEEDEEMAPVRVVADLGHLSKKRFMTAMDCRNWLHPYDANGKRCPLDAMPRHIGKLVDDPYRALASQVRREGGYAKTTVPYAEFMWADYFRHHIRRHHVEAKFDKVKARAIALAQDDEAAYLPGWIGKAPA